MHRRHPYHEKTTCLLYSTSPSSDRTSKVYTRKELVLIETPIIEFHEKFYIKKIQKLAFHLPHVCIRGIHHFVKELLKEFKLRGNLHDILCCRDYAEQVVYSFSHQIQS